MNILFVFCLIKYTFAQCGGLLSSQSGEILSPMEPRDPSMYLKNGSNFKKIQLIFENHSYYTKCIQNSFYIMNHNL